MNERIKSLQKNVPQDDGTYDYVKWSYIEHLHKLQMEDSLILANKLGVRHINYRRAAYFL